MTEPPIADLELIRNDLMHAARRLASRRVRRRRTVRAGIVAGGGVALLGGAAVAAERLLGGPAPPAVKRDLAAVDSGLPADLRLNPDVVHAHSVASTGASTVYYAALSDGGYCAELVTAGERRRGAVCTTDASAGNHPIGVTVPFTDPVKADSPVTVSGRVELADAVRLELRYPDGATDRVRLGLGRFYVYDVPAEHLASVHAHGLLLVARNAAGSELASAVVPSDGVTPTKPSERTRDPLEAVTSVDDGDLSNVLAVSGRAPNGAATVELALADGPTTRAAVREGAFRLTLDSAARGALRRPATLTARAADGRAIARRVVAAPSFWLARERAGDDSTEYCYRTPLRATVCKDG